LWHTRDVEIPEDAKKDPNDVLPVSKEKAREDGQQALQHIRTLLSLVLTNSEVRKLLSDFSLIGRDLLSKAATKAATGIAPSSEALAGVNDSAPQDQFVTEGGRRVGTNETPVLEVDLPGGGKVAQHPKQDLGTAAKVTTSNGDTQSGARAYDVAKQEGERLKADGQVQGRQEIDKAQRQVDEIEASSEPDVAAKKTLVERMKGMRDGLSDKIPQQHKDTANQHFERGKVFLTEEYFPEERRDQFLFRGKKVIIECQKHKDYQESLKWLLSFLEEYAEHGSTIADHGKDSGNTITSDPTLNQAAKELRTILERFANGQSLSVIIDAVNALIDDAKRDPELKDWFKKVDTYIRKVLLDAGYVLEPDCNTQATALRESGRSFYDDKYKTHFDNLFSSTTGWFKSMGEDPLNKRFGEDWARLTRDLLFDSEGSLKFKPNLWKDVRKVIVPTLIDKIGIFPIPRVEFSDDSLDLVVENLTLSGRNLFPNIISIEAHNFVKFSPYQTIKDEQHHEFTLTFGQIQADMRDVAFYFHKKSGIPKMKDSGLADIVLGGEGLTATVHLASAGKDKSSVFKVKNVVVKVDSLKFAIRDSKHDFLYKTLKPLATGLVKKQIQKAVADAITTGFEYVDGQLVGVRTRLQEADGVEGETRTKVLTDMFKRKKDETSAKASDAHSMTTTTTSQSQFKVVNNKRNSLLATAGHPAGWVNRTEKVEEVAKADKGEWRSDAFDIV